MSKNRTSSIQEILIDWFVRNWKVPAENTFNFGQKDRHRPGLIVAVSYTTLTERLIDATYKNLENARLLKTLFPDAYVTFSSCESYGYPFAGAGQIEDKFKTKFLAGFRISPVIAPHMGNTVEEAMNMKFVLDVREIYPRCIVICTGQLHGPSALLVWRMLYPEAEILVVATPYYLEIQPDHPVLDQRTIGRWIISNIKRQAALRACYSIWRVNRPLGLKALNQLRKIKHKST